LTNITARDTDWLMYDINTIAELIERLGGDTTLARHFGITQPAVANWKVRGEIGAGWHMRLYAMARRMNLTINPAVFGMSEAEFDPLGPKQKMGNEPGRTVSAA